MSADAPRCEAAENWRKEETMRNRVAATLITLVLLLSHIASAHALTNGWNFVRAYNCYGSNSGGVDFLQIFPTTGGFLQTTDPVVITSVAPLCSSGDGFYVYLNGNIWIAISIYPFIK
jgi:hypothetical protein